MFKTDFLINIQIPKIEFFLLCVIYIFGCEHRYLIQTGTCLS